MPQLREILYIITIYIMINIGARLTLVTHVADIDRYIVGHNLR
jgi:hypothetical protein